MGGALPLMIVTSFAGSCGFGELFSSAGPGEVQFVWVGPTEVPIDSAISFEVTLLVDGVPATTPPVRLTIPDTTRIDFGATQDSIIGKRQGFGDVVAWIENSMTPRIDTVFRVRART